MCLRFGRKGTRPPAGAPKEQVVMTDTYMMGWEGGLKMSTSDRELGMSY